MSNKNKKRILYIVSGVFIVLALIASASYAYITFTASGSDNLIKAGCLKINVLSEGTGINIPDGVPTTDEDGLKQTPYTITIKNTCNIVANYTTTLNAINDSNLSNRSKIKVAISGSVTKEPTLLSYYSLATLDEKPDYVQQSYLIESGELGINEERTYNLKMWIDYNAKEFTGSFESKIIIEATAKNARPDSVLSTSWRTYATNYNDFQEIYTFNKKVLPDTFQNKDNIEYTKVSEVDVSAERKGGVMLGTYQNGDSTIAVISSHNGVLAPNNCNRLFYRLINCEYIDLSYFDTRNVVSMLEMFLSNKKLKSINLSNIDTSKVTNMQALFADCPNLTSLDLTSFNTKKVQLMIEMFASCTNLTKATVGCDWSYESIKTTGSDFTSMSGTEWMYNGAGINSVTRVCTE